MCILVGHPVYEDRKISGGEFSPLFWTLTWCEGTRLSVLSFFVVVFFSYRNPLRGKVTRRSELPGDFGWAVVGDPPALRGLPRPRQAQGHRSPGGEAATCWRATHGTHPLPYLPFPFLSFSSIFCMELMWTPISSLLLPFPFAILPPFTSLPLPHTQTNARQILHSRAQN